MTFSKALAGVVSIAFLTACTHLNAADASTSTEAATEAAQSDVDLSDAPSGSYKADQGHRYITFFYDHQGFSEPFVRWRSWDADLDWNAEDPEKSSVSVVIDATSIDTGVDVFDGHLRGERFFNVETHPTITFDSTELVRTGPATGKMTGDLSIKGITKPVTLDVTFKKAAFNQRANGAKIGFSARGSLLRSEFDLGLAVPIVGDEVSIIIEVEFDEEKAAE